MLGFTKTKSFVTEGFKPVGTMVSAVKTVDGVGLALVTCQEPKFCADALNGKITAAVKQGTKEVDYRL